MIPFGRDAVEAAVRPGRTATGAPPTVPSRTTRAMEICGSPRGPGWHMKGKPWPDPHAGGDFLTEHEQDARVMTFAAQFEDFERATTFPSWSVWPFRWLPARRMRRC
jgi:hypothetical protein